MKICRTSLVQFLGKAKEQRLLSKTLTQLTSTQILMFSGNSNNFCVYFSAKQHCNTFDITIKTINITMTSNGLLGILSLPTTYLFLRLLSINTILEFKVIDIHVISIKGKKQR